MFISTFQGLTLVDFVLSASGRKTAPRYPFDVPHLTFYRARNAIYHLFKALKSTSAHLIVLVPDYNSGNEVLALEAAGATIRYYPVGSDGQADVPVVERLCEIHRPDVLYVIHNLGWPQPIRQLADLAHRRGLWLVEDCALALLSDVGADLKVGTTRPIGTGADLKVGTARPIGATRPLGSFGHFSIFCLYKTLPLPNGACLVENGEHLAGLDDVRLRQAGLPSVLGRTAELMVRRIRSRSDSLGAAMQSMKRAAGRAAGAMEVSRAKIGDIGFNIDDVDLAMSEISARLLKHLDFEEVRSRRIENYHRLASRIGGLVTPLHGELPAGACPLLFPILVEDKPTTADRLRGCGIDVLEFWNHGVDAAGGAGYQRGTGLASQGTTDVPPSRAQYLRRHVLGLPIHQDLTDRHIDYVAEHVSRLHLRMP
jgi:dTDP-4-amino-4,6-dideoxygalactose transaminase